MRRSSGSSRVRGCETNANPGFPMTDDMMDLQNLVEKAPVPISGRLGFAAKRLMEMEVGAITGALGERSGLRLVQRNGYRDRD